MNLDFPATIAVDTETSGTRPSLHELLSVAIVPSWTTRAAIVVYVTPTKPVDSEAARINGYTPELWAQRGAMSLPVAMDIVAESFKLLYEQRPRAVIVAHNSGFDRGFLEESAAACGVKLPIRHAWECSMTLMGRLMRKHLIPWGNLKLDRLGELSGQWPVGGRPAIHDVEQDARACLRGYKWLCDLDARPVELLRRFYRLSASGGATTGEWLELNSIVGDFLGYKKEGGAANS